MERPQPKKPKAVKTENLASAQAPIEQKVEEKSSEIVENKAAETKATPDKETVVDKVTKPKAKHTAAFARGVSLSASKKHCMYICTFIKNKTIDAALSDLQLVLAYKIAVPFKGEIPHRKGMMSGRYPINATKLFIPMLKGLRGNVLANGLDLEKTRITEASASWASRPHKKGGARFKRTHVILKAEEVNQEKKK